MDFVNVERGLVDRLLMASGAEGAVGPREAGEVIELACGGGTRFGMEAVRVGFEAGFAVLAFHGELVGVVFLQAGDEALPKLPVAFEGIGGFVPVIKLPHDGHALSAGRPCAETPTFHAVAGFGMGAEIAPSVRQDAFVETLLLVFLDWRGFRHSVLHTVFSSPSMVRGAPHRPARRSGRRTRRPGAKFPARSAWAGP